MAMTKYNNVGEATEEEYPDVLPDPNTLSRKWIWREDSNSLELVSTGVNTGTSLNIMKQNKKTGANVHFPELQRPSGKPYRRGQVTFGNRVKNATSPRSSTKITKNDNRVVSVHDVKDVAYELLSDVLDVPRPFQECLRTDQFDNFLMTLLYYFEAYFERLNLENKPRPMAVEPSAAEKEAMFSVTNRQLAAQRLLASKYCTLILGLGIESQHHMACGRQRKSYTKRDRALYETIYTFSTYAVWITFRRRDIELIGQELGRQFRSDTFNPASRPTDDNDFKLAKDLTKEENPDFNLAPDSLRLRQKRPAIKSIINQRSPVLISLLPTSKESSPWLLDRRKGLAAALGEVSKLEEKELQKDLPLRIGIIGEPMAGFNPMSLAPFGEDHEDEDTQRPYSGSPVEDRENEDYTPDNENKDELGQ